VVRSGCCRCIRRGHLRLHNGIRRTFRDRKAIAYEAARVAKTEHPGDLIEIVDRSNGIKMLMLPDGRTA
jgi:hypothetical protein